jgi:hypothetical protein
MRGIYSRFLSGIMAIDGRSKTKRTAKNNTHACLKMKYCRLVELTQNTRIEIVNECKEHMKNIRLNAGKCLRRTSTMLTVKITGGRTRNNKQPHLRVTVSGSPSLFAAQQQLTSTIWAS